MISNSDNVLKILQIEPKHRAIYNQQTSVHVGLTWDVTNTLSSAASGEGGGGVELAPP
jgi:hypothetical protein